MAGYVVTGEGGEVRVEASNWLGALGLALPMLGLSAGALGRLVCSVAADGSADAHDPLTNTRVRVAPVVVPPPPSFDMPAAGFEMRPPSPVIETSLDETLELPAGAEDEAADNAQREVEEIDEAWFKTRDDPHDYPFPLRGGDAADIDDRMTVVFERCEVIAAASDVRSACAAALTVLAELIPADAGAVLVRTRSGSSLRFIAAFGPKAMKVVDTAIPVDQGIAGFCHGFRMGVVVEDVSHDDRHYARVDRASGYRTNSLLAVPLLSADQVCAGCMELLNSPAGFQAADLEVASVVARSLAEWLAPALG